MATKKKNVKRNTKKSPVKNSPFSREITFVCIILISVLILLSYFGLCGPAGKFIDDFLFGIFGIIAYIFPLMLLLGSGFFISNQGNARIQRKVIYASILYIFVASIFQWAMDEPTSKLIEYFDQSAKHHTGGGFLGGALFHGLNTTLGRAGSLVVLITISIVCVILISGKLFFTAVSESIFERDEVVEPQKPTLPRKRQRVMKSYEFPKEETPETPIPEKPQKAPRKRRVKKQQPVMEEVLPVEVPPVENEISIHRSETPSTIYEEELESKFGKEDKPSKLEKTQPVSKEQPITLNHEPQKPKGDFEFPSLDLLTSPKGGSAGVSDRQLMDIAGKLQSTLESFGVRVKMGDVSCGPSVTRYELVPEQGVKVSQITRLADDIKLSLAASDIRIEAPIPGKAAVGIEVPNQQKTMVTLRELLESKEFQTAKSKISFAVGKNISGKTIVTDVAKMPHMLIAGSTGSGKSVCINTLIMSILYKAHPDEVKLILIDPKQVEFGVYNDIPHLMIPVVTDPKKASAALNWAVAEMTNRYNKFSQLGVRNMESYNKRIEKLSNQETEEYTRMPQIVIVVDEFADLMMVAPGEVEDAVCRLAQLARAAGIHLVLATQRPSVNVITGLIKANIPSRIALSVSSSVDSRTIIDGAGAEKLLGNGDMLFAPGDLPKPVRIQGAFVSEKEVGKVVDFLKGQFESPTYNNDVSAQIEAAPSHETGGANVGGGDRERDELFASAGQFIIEKDKASIGMLQRVFRIGFNRAARIMDQLSEAGVVGPEEGTKPRTVLMSEEQFENYLEEQ